MLTGLAITSEYLQAILVTMMTQSDFMTHVYRLLEYSHLVTDLQQSKRHSNTTVRGAPNRQKTCDFATDAAGVTTIDDSQQKCGAYTETEVGYPRESTRQTVCCETE